MESFLKQSNRPSPCGPCISLVIPQIPFRAIKSIPSNTEWHIEKVVSFVIFALGERQSLWYFFSNRNLLITTHRTWVNLVFKICIMYVYFMHMGILPAYIPVHHVCAWCPWRLEAHQVPLELEVQIVVSALWVEPRLSERPVSVLPSLSI